MGKLCIILCKLIKCFIYRFSFWFKWDYLWREDYAFDFDIFTDLIELAFLSETEDSALND